MYWRWLLLEIVTHLLSQSVAELWDVVARKQQLSLEAFRVRNARLYDTIKDHWHTVAKQRQKDAGGTGPKVSGSPRDSKARPSAWHRSGDCQKGSVQQQPFGICCCAH